jgi:hypothetical protein
MRSFWLYLWATVVAPLSVVGQGMFTFDNYLPSKGIDAPFIYPFNYCGERYFPMEGSGWSFQLLAGPIGSQLQPLEPVTILKADGPGYVVPITLAVPAVSAGSWANVLVQIRYDSQGVLAGC